MADSDKIDFMEFFSGYVLRRGDQVQYRGGESHQLHGATSGIYTVHDTGEYLMCGYVEVKDALGRIFPIDAAYLEPVVPAAKMADAVELEPVAAAVPVTSAAAAAFPG